MIVIGGIDRISGTGLRAFHPGFRPLKVYELKMSSYTFVLPLYCFCTFCIALCTNLI